MRTTFHYSEVKARRRNDLPHLDVENGSYFVTFCLRDAITPAFLDRHERLKDARLERLRQPDGTLKTADRRLVDREMIGLVFSEMDRGRGSCVLADPRAARMVVESLRHFDRVRYRLYAYSVMPNHVHTAFRPFEGFPWWSIVGGWKSFTCREVNRVLGRTGSLWQTDNFDRLIRNNRHLGRVVRYIVRNPEKAGLEDWPWVGQFIGPPWVE